MFRRRRSEEDFAAEIRSHLELEAEELEREGVNHDEARYQAVRTFGNVRAAQERFYLRDRSEWIENLSRDLRYALRQLRKNPSFALMAILVLAFGMGAALTIFAFVDAALIRPLPYAQPSRLISAFESNQTGPRFHLSWLDYLDWKQRNHVFQSLDIYTEGNFMLNTLSAVERVSGATVSSGFFRTLGVSPALGRDFRDGEDRSSASNLVILSFAAWQKRFGGEHSAIGRVLNINGTDATVVGVLPRSFQFAPAGTPEFWLISTPHGCNADRGCHNSVGVARLKDGVSLAAASAEMSNVAAAIAKEYPDSDLHRGATIVALSDVIVGEIRPVLKMLLVGAILLLLIAMVNVASLLLVRSEKRRREIAVRGALGASAPRLTWQFMTEGLLLSIIATTIGVALAWLGIHMLALLIPADRLTEMPYLEYATLNGHVTIAAVFLAAISAVICTVTPALRLSHDALRAGLTENGRSETGAVWRRMGANLVALELATAMILLACAGLLGKSFYKLSHVDAGMVADNLAILHVTNQPCLPGGWRASPCATGQEGNDNAQQIATADRVLTALQALPGTTSAAVATDVPVGDGDGISRISFPDMPNVGEPEANGRWVSEQYLSTLGARLLRGRYFNAHDDAKSTNVTIVNSTLAKRFYGGRDPIGARIRVSDTDLQIIGVVEDIKEGQLDMATLPVLYLPFRQNPSGTFFVVVRSSQSAESMLPAMTDALHKLDRSLATYEGDTMAARIHDSPSAYLHRASAWVVGGFAVMALLLGVVGLYGVIAYSVRQRTREIGVRMALGAQRGAIHRMVLGEAARLAIIGMSMGIVCSLVAGSLLHGLLFGVSAWDPATLAAVAVVLSVAVLAASFIPARAAALVDPMRALRAE